IYTCHVFTCRTMTGRVYPLSLHDALPIFPGAEAAQVVTLAREWTRAFGEISIGGSADPVITLQLSGVDYDVLLDRVASEDNPSARRTLLRSLLLEELGASTSGGMMQEILFRHIWRGDRREAELVFGNVRDPQSLGPDQFRASSGRWRVVVDYPFDEGDHSPTDDVARVEGLRRDGFTSTTVVWIPHFLSSGRMDDVGTLVQLEHLLTGRHFDDNAGILPINDREPARRALESRRKGLREGLLTALRQAYAVQAPSDGHIGGKVAPGDNFLSLDDNATIEMPTAPTLRAGLTDVLHQMLARQYPQHPEVAQGEAEVRQAELNAVLALVRKA